MGVAEHSKTTYLELQRKKVHRYVIFKIDEKKKEVVVEKTGGPAESYDDFTASLPENDCRYAIYDFDFVTSENCQKSKIFFIAWLVSFSNAQIRTILLESRRNSADENVFYALLSKFLADDVITLVILIPIYSWVCFCWLKL
jgi:cofilin